jgi:hypothetical protein
MVDMALKLDKKPAYPYGCPCGGGGGVEAPDAIRLKTRGSKNTAIQNKRILATINNH